MVKQINAKLPDELHRVLRVKLAEEGANFSDWLREQVKEYVSGKITKGKPRRGKGGRG